MKLVVYATLTTTAVAATLDSEDAGCFLKKSRFAPPASVMTPEQAELAKDGAYWYGTASKPFPSLTQCYKNNQDSCCVSAHDSYIGSEYASLLSPTCLREYDVLEAYFCLGCFPNQGRYVAKENYTADGRIATPAEILVGDGNITEEARYTFGIFSSPDGPYEAGNFKVRICRSFVESLYSPEIANSNYNYDNCGLVKDGVGFLPKERFENATMFIEAIRPPYFEHVIWEIVDDSILGHPECFQAGNSATVSMVVLLISLVTMMFKL
jgi:hypothetical protein